MRFKINVHAARGNYVTISLNTERRAFILLYNPRNSSEWLAQQNVIEKAFSCGMSVFFTDSHFMGQMLGWKLLSATNHRTHNFVKYFHSATFCSTVVHGPTREHFVITRKVAIFAPF
jgi:hypothetical protein